MTTKNLTEGKDYDKLSNEAKDLILFADNDRDLHRQSTQPILKNLAKKKIKGNYDSDFAKKLWGYHADRAAQKLTKDHGDEHDIWHKKYSPSVRKEAAGHWEEFHRDSLEDHLKEDLNESAFSRMSSKLQRKGLSDKEAGRAAYGVGKKKDKEKQSRKDESVYYTMVQAVLEDKPAVFKEAFAEAVQPELLARIEQIKDELRTFIFRFTNGENVAAENTNIEVESALSEGSRQLLGKYAVKKSDSKKTWAKGIDHADLDNEIHASIHSQDRTGWDRSKRRFAEPVNA